MTLVPIETADGSKTLFDTEQQVHYRSLDGAEGEAQYVFIQSSALERWTHEWTVLELGFGTGMNFRKTVQAAQTAQVKLNYHVVEMAPIQAQIYQEICPQPLQGLDLELVTVLNQIQDQNYTQQTMGQVELHLYHQAWQECKLPEQLMAQAIFHDPFGPRSNPACWTRECFEWEIKHLHPQGRLVTYAAATDARRAMVQAGLCIGSLPGAGRKREMTVAAWSDEFLSGTKILKNKRFYV